MCHSGQCKIIVKDECVAWNRSLFSVPGEDLSKVCLKESWRLCWKTAPQRRATLSRAWDRRIALRGRYTALPAFVLSFLRMRSTRVAFFVSGPGGQGSLYSSCFGRAVAMKGLRETVGALHDVRFRIGEVVLVFREAGGSY
jgi:hypothetical protein